MYGYECNDNDDGTILVIKIDFIRVVVVILVVFIVDGTETSPRIIIRILLRLVMVIPQFRVLWTTAAFVVVVLVV